MLGIIIILVRLFLAFYIISTLYMVLVYYVRNLSESNNPEPKKELEFTEKHLALVYTEYLSEQTLLAKIMELNNQDYKNYSAYFFTNESLVEVNNLENIFFIKPQHNKHRGMSLLQQVKAYLLEESQAVIVLKPDTELGPYFLKMMNLNLYEGKKIVQGQLQLKGENKLGHKYQQYAKRFLNFIDRQAKDANGLSSSIWSHGFMIERGIFESTTFAGMGDNDKALQADLISRSHKIYYEPDAKIFESPLNDNEVMETKKAWLNLYFLNLKIGFQLLLEGVRNPSMDKIVFGLNYLRPPLYIMLTASVLLAVVDYLYMPSFALSFGLALLGITASVILLFRPHQIMDLIKNKVLANSSRGIG